MEFISIAPGVLAQIYGRQPREWTEAEHDALWAEAKRLTRARPPTPRPTAPSFDGVFDELRAARAGREAGQRFRGDPYQAARVLGVRVERVPAGTLRDSSRPNTTILGRCWNVGAGFIQLAAGQSPVEETRTLAHELAHQAGVTEAYCDAYARAFLREAPLSPAEERHRAQAAWDCLLGRSSS